MPFWSRKPQQFTDTGIRHDWGSVLGSVQKLTGQVPAILDSTFIPVSHDWLMDSRTLRAMRTHFWGLPQYQSQAWDCENFATELVQWICRQAALSDIPASPEAFVMCVENKVPFAGVSDGRHALNLIQTDREPIVIEPQSIRNGMITAPFCDYPNRAFKVYQ